MTRDDCPTGRRIEGLLGIVFVALYPLLDIVFQKHPELGNIGFLWIVGLFLAIMLSAGWAIYRLWQIARHERRWLTLALLGMWLVFILAIALPENFVCDENIMQVGCLFESLVNPITSGYLSTCFIGYPRRSFLLQALPSLAFGISPFTLNVGASLLLLPGLGLFAYGIRRLTAAARESDLITAGALALLFQCTIFIRIVLYHDQTSQPIAATLCLIGLLVMATLDQSRVALVIMLGLLALGTSLYPPILPVILLALFVLGWATYRKRLPSRSLSTVVIGFVVVVISFLQTLRYRGDLRLGVSELTSTDSFARWKQLFLFLVLQENGEPFATWLLHGLFVGTLIIGVLGLFGLRAWILCAWAVGVIGAAFFADGYHPALTWQFMSGIHRAASIFPIILALAAVLIAAWAKQRQVKIVPRVLVLIFASIPAISSLLSYDYPKLPPFSLEVYRAVQATLPEEQQQHVSMFLRSDISHLYVFPRHYRYLTPKAIFNSYTDRCLPDVMLPENSIVLTGEDESCRAEDLSRYNLEKIGSRQFSDITVNVFRVKAASIR